MERLQTLIKVAGLTTLFSSNVFATISVEDSIRLAHAQEMMGRTYRKSVVQAAEHVNDMEAHINRIVAQSIKKTSAKKAKLVSAEIINQAMNYGFDPVFVMAVIQNESSFDPTIVGTVGEIGLMQIRPETAAWICKKYKLTYKGKKSLYDPTENVRIGTAYLDYLRSEFAGNGQLYLSAYNMGARNVRRLLAKQATPKEYADRVMIRYVAFYKDIARGEKELLEKSLVARN